MKQDKTHRDRIIRFFEENKEGRYQASDIAADFGLRRNVASTILNDLHRQGILNKEKTRPVLFSSSRLATIGPLEPPQDDLGPFVNFIGATRSLKSQINNCKISVSYPHRGIPIMILGDSGVGKSMLAELIYEYARYKEVIPADAPFVVLNCADYAHNKELLSSVLFGYNKGAFTGANADTSGLFEEADNGYLFLDEVHRLPPEGQEKLFKYIDKGVISRLGVGGKDRKLNVRLVFATTEKADNVLLDTFLRRIAITVTLPPYYERSGDEKLEIITKLFKLEAEILNCDLSISNNVVNYLLTFKGKGNIGTLKNIIKVSCAQGYERSANKSEIKITLEDLNIQVNEIPSETVIRFSNQWLKIVKNEVEKDEEKVRDIQSIVNADELSTLVKSHVKNMHKVDVDQHIHQYIRQLTDNLAYYYVSPSLELIYRGHVENIMVFLQNNYGISTTGTSIIVLTKLVMIISQNEISGPDDEHYDITYLEDIVSKNLFRSYKITSIVYDMIKQMTDLEPQPSLIKILMTLFFHQLSGQRKDTCSVIVIAHGYSTASSIASLVNRVYSQYVFDAFDMPYETPQAVIVEKVKHYLTQIDTSNDVLILADMGSVLDIIDEVSGLVKGNIGIINNVTTQMALEVGNYVTNNRDIETLLKKIVRYNATTYRFIRKKEKELAIIVCCITGFGVALKLKKILQTCFEGMNIKVVEYEYDKIQMQQTDCEIFDLYNVALIISTVDFKLKGYSVLPLNKLIDQTGYQLIMHALEEYFAIRYIDTAFERIVKNFSLTNIMSQLTILNPEIIINDVERAIKSIEIETQVSFAPDLKQLLYMHIGIMVERLMQSKGESATEYTKFVEQHPQFYQIARKSLEEIEKRYHVKVNHREIKLIYDIIVGKGYDIEVSLLPS